MRTPLPVVDAPISYTGEVIGFGNTMIEVPIEKTITERMESGTLNGFDSIVTGQWIENPLYDEPIALKFYQSCIMEKKVLAKL